MHTRLKAPRFKLKPINLLDRLFSTLLIAVLLIGQPAAVVRVLAQEVPRPDSPTPFAPGQILRPFVGTEQADYPPGATAYIVGRDFQAGEIVTLQVLHADGTPDSGADHASWTVSAGTDGTFQSSWHVYEDDCLGATLMLTATGQTSGLVAQMQFTDGTPSGTSPVPGSLYAMGWNPYGQLGTGDNVNRATPTPVVSLPGGRKVIAVTGGDLHSLAQANDGSLWAWGYGGYGSIGNNTYSTTYVPVPVNALPGGRTAVSIAAGTYHNLVLANDGSMWAWGQGGNGQLGNGGSVSFPYPVPVNALPDGRIAVQIAAGGYHNLALANDGSLWAWGAGYNGQMGNGSTANAYYAPIAVDTLPGGRSVQTIAAGYLHSLALATDGTIWAWGYGGVGQLGNGASGNANTRVAVNPLPGGRVPVAIAAGIFHSLALASDGTAWAWGYGDYGQMGNGSTASAYAPIAVNTLPGGRSVQTIAASGYHNYSLATDGSMWAWGYGSDGELGNGSFITSSPYGIASPVPVNPLPLGKSILRIAGSGFGHGFILASDGNQAPLAANDNFTVNEDTALSVAAPGVLGNDTDADSQPLTASLSIAPANAAAFALNANGSFTYTPNASFHGTDSFTYRAFDGTDYSLPATVTITVTSVNDAPLVNAQSVTTSEDTAANVTLTGSDVDGDALTFSVVSGPAHGTLSGTAPNLTYTPAANYNGPDGFSFLANDGTVASAPATVSLNVTPVNDGPVANAQSVTTPEDTAVAITLTGSDAENGLMSFAIVNDPAHGSLSGSAPNVTYTPALNYHGPDSFTFLLSDGELASAVVTVSITVNPVNDAPVANAQSVATTEDAAANITLTGSDMDGDALAFTVLANPAHGMLSGTAPNLTYTPAANYNGPDSFTFMVNDSALDSAVATVSITVNTVNDGPELATPGDKLVNELDPLAFTLSATDVDLPTDMLTYSIASGGESGMTLDGSSGDFAWTPTEAQGPGVYTVTFRVTDLAGVMSEQTITITVSEVNLVPTITDVPAEATIPELVNYTFDASGSDPDAPVQSLTYSLVNAPAGATIDATTGVFNWMPAEDQGAGNYTFKVRISDGVTTADAPIVLHVTEVNVPPVLTSPGNQAVDEQATLAFALAATDADLPANTLSYSIASGAEPGMTLDAGTGAFAWTPTEAQGPGSYTVTFRAADGGGLMSEQNITITVNEVNAAPAADAQMVTTAEDTALGITLTGSDVDLPANTLTYAVVSGPLHGSLSGTAPNLTYTPAANYHGSDSFSFEVNDGNATATAVIGITVTPVNDTPMADSQAVALNEDTVVNIALTGSDIDGDALSYGIVSGPAHGVLSGVAPSLVYTPAANYFGPDSFTFKVNDGAADSPSAIISITVNPVNDAPVAQAHSITINEDSGANAINVLANDSFAPDAPETLAVIGVTPGANGTVTFTAAGVSYAPAPDFYGSDSFTYTIGDGNGGSATTTVAVTVLNVNDAPVLTLAAASPLPINENDVVSLAGSLTDADPLDAHVVTIAWADGSANTVLNLAAGVLTFSTSHRYLDDGPTATASDVKTISVSLADNNGGSAAANQTVTVNNVAPVITSITGPVGPLAKGTSASVTVNFSDVGTLDSHSVRLVWDDGTPDTVLSTGGFARTASHTYAAPGVYSVGVTVTDDDTGVATTTFEYIVVYDPNGGFVTGGGWVNSPAGAYVADATLTGKASFGFVSKYQKGTTIPTGETEFQFHAAGFKFQSTIYEWLVVSGPLAQYKGSGTINGTGDYGFLLTATDGQVSGGGGVDKFRIKIWVKTYGEVIYDNAMGVSDDINNANPQVIGGGSIVVHKPK